MPDFNRHQGSKQEHKRQWRQLWAAGAAKAPSAKAKAKAKAKATGKAKARGIPPRSAAREQVLAVDHCLLTMVGLTLQHFVAAQGPAGYSRVPRPLLVLCLDQGSPGWSSCFWLAYHCLARVAVIHDPFHRCWNDLCNGLKDTQLWWVVHLSTMVYNVMYGPWEGSKWFSVLRLGASDFFQAADAGDPLLSSHYPFICRDLGLPEEGTPEHIREVARRVADGPCLHKKGPRSATRRWFQWFEATDQHLDWWHSRLMIMSYVGLQLGNYASIGSLPLFGDTVLGDGFSAPPPEADRMDAGKAGAVVQEMVGQAASSSSAAPPRQGSP